MAYERLIEDISFFIDMFVEIPEVDPYKLRCIRENEDPEGILKWNKCYLPRYQEEFIHTVLRRIRHYKGLVVEKSEKMGATMSMVLISLWYFLFIPRSDILIVKPHRKDVYTEDYLNLLIKNPEELRNNSPMPIMNLILLMYKRLPTKLKPYFGIELKEDKEQHYKCYIINHDNKNRIYVTSNHKEFFLDDLLMQDKTREQRYFKAIFLDDMAFNRKVDNLWPQLKPHTDSVICISSPNGKNNLFYELKENHSADLYTLHWILKPETSKQWYNGIQKISTPDYIEQYLNINYDIKYIKKRKKTEKNKTRKVNTSILNVISTQSLNNTPTANFKLSEEAIQFEVEREKAKKIEKEKKKNEKKQNISCLTGKNRSEHKNPKEIKVLEYNEVLKKLISGESKSVNLPIVKENSKSEMITSTSKLENLISMKEIRFCYYIGYCLDIMYEVYDKQHELNKVKYSRPTKERRYSYRKTEEIFGIECTKEDEKESIAKEEAIAREELKVEQAKKAEYKLQQEQLQQQNRKSNGLAEKKAKEERKKAIAKAWLQFEDDNFFDRNPIEPHEIKQLKARKKQIESQENHNANRKTKKT